MREVTQTFKVLKFEELCEFAKEVARENFHLKYDLYSHCMEERVETLKSVAKYLNCNLDYAISCVPDRGDYISLIPNYSYSQFESDLESMLRIEKSCPFTGVCYDDDILEMIKNNIAKSAQKINGVRNAMNDYIKSIHEEYESMLKDDYLKEYCEANEIEFLVDGEVYN